MAANTVLIVALLIFQLNLAITLPEFDIYRRDSEEVTRVLGASRLPDKDTVEYHSALVARDQHRYSKQQQSPALTFRGGDQTTIIHNLKHLHYVNIYVGAPATSFLVALDTGRFLFWLPCQCHNCKHDFISDYNERVNVSIYTPDASSTSQVIYCGTPECWPKQKCSFLTPHPCFYDVDYHSPNTSTKGYLVKDVLHLDTFDGKRVPSKAPIVFGCGTTQKGYTLSGGPINGLIGLGFDRSVDVPKQWASRGLVGDSFSLCLALDGTGRIAFGDRGSSDMMETPLVDSSRESGVYNIWIENIVVDASISNFGFEAIFDSGTSVTLLNEQAYNFVTENFNERFKHLRIFPDSLLGIPFEYCYLTSQNNKTEGTHIKFTVKGGGYIDFLDPLIAIRKFLDVSCLAVIKDPSHNIIGQNFMSGHRFVFDREKFVLRWKRSDCKYKEKQTQRLAGHQYRL